MPINPNFEEQLSDIIGTIYTTDGGGLDIKENFNGEEYTIFLATSQDNPTLLDSFLKFLEDNKISHIVRKTNHEEFNQDVRVVLAVIPQPEMDEHCVSYYELISAMQTYQIAQELLLNSKLGSESNRIRAMGYHFDGIVAMYDFDFQEIMLDNIF